MKKSKLLLISFVFLAFILLKINVNAATAALEGGSDYASLKSSFDKGLTKYEVSNSEIITLYGKSVCNGTSCTLSYAGGITDFKDAIAKSVSCSDGKKYVIYNFAGSGNESYKSDNSEKYNGTVYWTEDYQITCTADKTDNTVSLDSSSTAKTTTKVQSSNYSSSTTVDNPNQGVETYFVVLGIVGIISYILMLIIKKYNLFKNV